MQEDETVANYVSKVTNIASEIESQGETLSDKLKMVRIISSLPPKFNNYKTVWYNTKEIRSIETMMSSLQLEEDNLKKIDVDDHAVQQNMAFSAKTNKSKFKKRVNIEELKKKTKCNICHCVGHWARECRKKKNANSSKNEENHVSFCASEVSSNKSDLSCVWIADSGASSHMSFHREWFIDYIKYQSKKFVKIANDDCLEIVGEGSIAIESRVGEKWEPRVLKKVLHVPKLKLNLFSTAAVTSKGFKMVIKDGGCVLMDSNNIVMAVGIKDENNQLRLEFRQRIDECANTAAVSLQQWHRRLGHINVNSIKKMSKDNLVTGINISDDNQFFCADCQLGKMVRATHSSTTKRLAVKGENLHADLCGPMEEEGIGGVRYFLLIKDEATSFRYVYFLHYKTEVYTKMSAFIPLVHNTIDKRIKRIRVDNGREFINQDVLNLLSKEGIEVERISSYTPEQNGQIERENRTVVESARTMLIASGLEKFLWPEAVRTAVYLLNRSPNSKCVSSTPFEKWFGTKPELGHVKIFGTECFVQIPKQHRKKWDPKAKKVHLVGFEPTTKNFRMFDALSRKVIISCDVRFNETKSNIIIIKDDDDNNGEMYSTNNIKQVDENLQKEETDDQDVFDDCESENTDQQDSTNNKEVERSNDRYRLRSATKAPDRLIENGYSVVEVEPISYEDALQSPNHKDWQEAIDEELRSLYENDTWELVCCPKNVNIVGCKWVFKLKPTASGMMYKARLVAKGFSQREGVDFHETFSPVVRYDSVRVVLCIAAIEDWEIMQFDVKTAFLNGDLDTEIYMRVPEGINTENRNVVCRLKKSLYGLKQASRVWNEKFSKFLKDFNFVQSNADSCVFLGDINGHKVILLLYVDDGLILSPSKTSLKTVMDHLSQNFMITNQLDNQYVGINFVRDRKHRKILINQRDYIRKLINKFEMANCNQLSTPADINVVLSKSNNQENEAFPYRQAVGSLMFAAIVSRPDIAYSVGAVSRYLENPSQAHVKAIKRIIRYLKGTINLGIEYGGSSSVALQGYTDSDHARDIDTRRSTSGYAFLINNSIVTWKSYLQKTVALSTAEAEYMAASDGAKEAIWLRQLLKDIGYEQKESTPLMIDNQSAIILTKNAEFHQRTKYIDIRYHFVRDHVKDGTIKTMYVSTNEQLADVLTKPLPAKKFESNLQLFGMRYLETISMSVEN